MAGLIAVASFSAASATSAFTTIDVAGAGKAAQQGTAISAINAAGDITGVFVDAKNVVHGFVLLAGGAVSTFDVPGAGTNSGQGTIPSSINSARVIVGTYVDANAASHGFMRAANGVITTFDAPGAPKTTTQRGTAALRINESGTIVGVYSTGNPTAPNLSTYHGFMRTAAGAITVIDDPYAGTGADQNGSKRGTFVSNINANGEIVGSYIDNNDVQHGFLRSPSGAFTSFAPPSGTFRGGSTDEFGVDSAGDVSGGYYDAAGVHHGFLLKANGVSVTLDAPVANLEPCTTHGMGKSFCGTMGVGLDAAGDASGAFVDSNGVVHGFLRPAETGVITTFSDPNAGSSGSMQGTFPAGIVSNASGIVIGGIYADTNSVLHGFIYTPVLTATTTVLKPAPAPNPSVYHQSVTLTATVSSPAGAPPNGENVTFDSGTASLGTALLSGGVGTLTTTNLPVGADSITATYSGDAEFSGSTSAAVNQAVGKAASRPELTVSSSSSTQREAVTLMVTVLGQLGGVPTGTVTFKAGAATVGAATLVGGSASLTTTVLPLGADSLTAVYVGDAHFRGSTSAAITHTVKAATLNIFNIGAAGTGAEQGTMITGIDVAGDTAGVFVDGGGLMHGFVRTAKGVVTTFEAPAAGAGTNQGTVPVSMDANGDLAGYYIVPRNTRFKAYRGFIRSAAGVITPVDVTGSNVEDTKPVGINATAGITGSYMDTAKVYHGFVRSTAGVLTTFDAPNAGKTSKLNIDSMGTTGVAINSTGTVAGRYVDESGVSHAFVRTSGGTLTPFDAPGAASGSCPGGAIKACGTFPGSIDSGGNIAGSFIDASGMMHGFLRSAAGGITVFNVPNAAAVAVGSILFGSSGMSLNEAGTISGTFVGVDGIAHGFQRTANGTITTFDAPGAATSGAFAGTMSAAINAGGTIVGGYTDNQTSFHGFIYTPSLTTTTTSLNTTPNPSIHGEPVTLTANVTSAIGMPPNGEYVAFQSGGATLGDAQLVDGIAGLTTTALARGTNAVTALYVGDVNFSGSASEPVSEAVQKATSTTRLAVSSSSSHLGQSVTLTATVTGQLGGIATGTVTFKTGNTTLGSTTLNSGGKTVLVSSALPLGADSLTATYGGDTNFTGSTSAPVSIVVVH
jgi:hypothetical protein